jgi:hypothetical protein
MKSLLDRAVSLTEMRGIVQQNSDRLVSGMAVYGAKVLLESLTLEQIENLKKNYQALIMTISESKSVEINNFSLHFILTISSGYLK